MRTSLLVAPLMWSACSSRGPTPSAEVSGALTVGGKPVVVTACHPGHGEHVFVELITPAGVLRFEDKQLYWNPTPDAADRGVRLDCEKLGRSWGGGVRADGSAYWRGRLEFTCNDAGEASARSGSAGARSTADAVRRSIAGKLALDCGHITDLERSELDKNRQDLLDQQGSAH